MEPIEHFLQCRFCMALNPVYMSTSMPSSSLASHFQSNGGTISEPNDQPTNLSTPTELAGADERYDGAAADDEADNYDTGSDDNNQELNETLIKSNTLSYSYRKMCRTTERINGDTDHSLAERPLLDACSICLCAYETDCEVRYV